MNLKVWVLAWMALLIYPLRFHVSFEPSSANYSIIMVITSDTNQRPYYEYDEIPILDDDISSIDITRHSLPHGGYHISAQLMRWVDGQVILVDSTDTLILVN